MSNKQGQLSRADLLELLLEGDQQVEQLLTDTLGLESVARMSKLDLLSLQVNPDSDSSLHQVSDVNVTRLPSKFKDYHLTNPSLTASLRSHYWQLLEQKDREDEESLNDEEVVATTRPMWRNKPSQQSFQPLMSEAAIQQRLLPCLRQKRVISHVDMIKLIDQVSRAEFVTGLPLQSLSRDTQAVQIIDDRQVHLMPYWLDHSWLTWHVQCAMAEYRLSRAVIEQGETEPQSIQHDDLCEYQPPPEGSTVLLLSDLGVLRGRLPDYQVLLDKLVRQGYHIVVVTPCHVRDYPQSLSTQVMLLSWEEHCSVLPENNNNSESEFSCTRQQWAETLLTLCSVTVRLEPELLRGVRGALNKYRLKHGKQSLPAAAESLAWQHRAVAQAHSVAATVDPEENKEWQRTFMLEDFELKEAVLEVLRGLRVSLPDEIWFEEFLMLDRCCTEEEQKKLDWFEQDAADVGAFFSYMHQRALSGEGISAEQLPQYQAWMQRVATRITGEVVSEGQFRDVVQLCLQKVSDADGNVPGGHVLDPRLAAKTKVSLSRKSAWLCQLGNRLVVTQRDPLKIPQRRSSLIARLDYRELQLNVIKGDKTLAVDLPERLGSAFIPLRGTEGLSLQTLRLQTDLTELMLDVFVRPAWARRVGRDAYGLFAELAIPNEAGKELAQCFRWIPAGMFMMGSPESEAEHFAGEDYHQVTLTEGYWLADTTVTQGLWRAIMGDNSVHFSSDMSNPANQVSWHDSQEFLIKLNKLCLEAGERLVIRLPSEAEWEYACRAGTTTPFSFGDNINSEQVNFDASSSYSSGVKLNSRNKVVTVKSLPANQWGLYEMHGNVREWCADAWKMDIGLQPVTDPYYRGDSSSDRVRRGGSWADNVVPVRSAARDNLSPDAAGHLIGLRLSLGHELRMWNVNE